MNPSRNTRALYIETSGQGVFALYDAPAARERRTAVLVCPPFGWEPMCPYRSRRELAEHLAGAGYPVLRIDLPGSGDSAGGPREPGRRQAWTRAVADACDWLIAESAAERLVAIGVGLGGLLAYQAACAGAPIDDLALWAVPARGRGLVRELRAYSLLPSSKVTGPQDPGAEIVPEGAIMAAGYMLSAETAKELESLDLTELPLPDASRRRVLMIGRTGTSVDEALRAALESSGASVSVSAGPGYRPVTDLLEPVRAWLDAGEDAPPSRTRSTPAPAAAAPVSSAHLDLPRAEPAVRETPLWIERPAGRLFGVLAEPAGEASGLCAVLLNPGPQYHIGPSRMWVELARRWASRGVPTLRVDLSRITASGPGLERAAQRTVIEGDAAALQELLAGDGDAAGHADDGTLHRAEYFAEVSAALDCLSARGMPRRFILVGLCAGAYWALHTALRDERVVSIAMLNPTALVATELSNADRRRRSLGRRLLRGSTWRRALSGEIPLERYVRVTRALGRRALPQRSNATRSALAARADSTARYAELFDRLQRRDQDGLLVFTRGERLAERLHARGLFEGGSERWPNLHLSLLETSDEAHFLTSLWLQQSVHRLLDETLQRELDRSLRASTIALSA